MTSKLRLEPPEALCDVRNGGDRSEPPQTHSQAQKVLPLCK